MNQKNIEKKGICPETAAKINKYVSQGLIFACGIGAGAVGTAYYYCGQAMELADKVSNVRQVSKQDLLNMLSGVHSKDEMYQITSKLLYGEVQKTDKMLKEVDSPDLMRLSVLQKRALCDVQDVIKIRAEKNRENDVAVRNAEIKFQTSFGKLQEYTKEQMLRSLGMVDVKTQQNSVQALKNSRRISKPINSR